jgi:glutathione S-transferase
VRTFDVVSSTLASVARGTSGLFCGVGHLGKRPEQLLELYEFEGCPFCRRVREMLSWLDLEAHVFPCPKGGKRFRDALRTRTERRSFPYLVDPNTGREMHESADIVRYLADTYGDGTVPLGVRGPVTIVTGSLAGGLRLAHGSRVRPSREPSLPLELYSFEASPYCRLVRETLCELQLGYILHNVARNSPSRPPFLARSGRMMVPYLVDPNTGVSMFESAEIRAYLEDTYAA